MNIYVLECDRLSLDASFHQCAAACQLEFETLSLPAQHSEISALFKGRRGGIVLLPADWNDLYCVKVTQELRRLSGNFQPVLVGPSPDVANLIAAFHGGAAAYLETPVNEVRLRQILTRAAQQFHDMNEDDENAGPATGTTHPMLATLTQSMLQRDHLLGHAFLDAMAGRGPLVEDHPRVLLVSNSQPQQRQMSTLLRQIGLKVAECGSIAEAVTQLGRDTFRMVISDTVLPDGDAGLLSSKIRKTVQGAIPKFTIWSSSPRKAEALLGPEHHVDDVILKPTPEIGLECVLPTLILSLYRDRDGADE